ncbi:MAG: glycerate kinase [Candidatus Zixiibacteriota bacterium]
MPGKEQALKEKGMEILRASLKASDPKTAILSKLKVQDELLYPYGDMVFKVSNPEDLETFSRDDYEFKLRDIERIFVVGFGKASASMARAIEDLLGQRIHRGIVITKRGYVENLSRMDLIEASHPIPDKDGVRGTELIIDLLKDTHEQDLVICLISGGGSSLFVAPCQGITLEEKQKLTDLLLKSGATIQEINAVRKHISLVKGGRLAHIAYPARILSLIFSDVVGDKLDSIASGPTAPDTTTFSDCMGILKKYELLEIIPQSIRTYLNENIEKTENETPKPGNPVFENVQNVIIGSNYLALKSAEKKANELGFNTYLLSDSIIGDTTNAAKKHSQMAKRIKEKGEPVSPPACFISGGETTVQVKGKGLGGRNQEFALVCAMEIEGMEDTVIMSLNTDGTDGPTDAAGAFCDGRTIQKAKKLNLDPKKYLENNDSYHFFEKVGGLIKTGPTNTNVMDIHIILVG